MSVCEVRSWGVKKCPESLFYLLFLSQKSKSKAILMRATKCVPNLYKQSKIIIFELFLITFDHFWIKPRFFEAAGAVVKTDLSLNLNQILLAQICGNALKFWTVFWRQWHKKLTKLIRNSLTVQFLNLGLISSVIDSLRLWKCWVKKILHIDEIIWAYVKTLWH